MHEPTTALALVSTGASPGQSSTGLSPGLVIAGRYHLSRYLARGGMAEVWLATHAELKSEVAIKVVDPRLTSDAATAPYALERFRFEAQISARLASRTRHVVAAHDAGEHQGLPYLVMEYVPGVTLEAEVERSGPIAPDRMAIILDQTADALEAAHAIGIVHRDLKPSNLMLVATPDGDAFVKVADFGVAKALARDLPLDRPRETAVGQLVGTPAFMSPEQLRGAPEIDARSDVWSLGVVVYEALTGRPAFEGATLTDLMVAIISKEVTPASRVRPDLPRTVDAWFARALAKLPGDRFQSAREAAAAFREALAIAPRKRASAIAAVSAIVLAACVLVIALLLGRTRPAPAAPPAAPVAAAPPTAIAEPPPPPPSSEPTVTPAPAERRALTATPVKPAPPPKHASASPSAPAPPAPPPAPPSAAPPSPPAPPPAEPPPLKKRIDPSEIQ